MIHFNEAILRGDFVKAKELASNLDIDTMRDALFQLAYDMENIAPYGFVTYLLLQNETSENHYIASILLCMGLNHLDGAYQTAFHHAKRAAELSPNDISYKEFLLYFYEIPDQLLRLEDAVEMAREILKVDPKNKAALKVIKGI